MPLPPKAALLAAAARRDWRAVLGLGPLEALTPKTARSYRVQCHPDRGGDPQIAQAVGQALDALLAEPPWWNPPPNWQAWEEFCEEERRARERQERYERYVTQWKASERERREREERERREEEPSGVGPRGRPNQGSSGDATPPERKRKLAEAARERRKRARPSPESIDATIAWLCEPSSMEEASSVEDVRKALKAAGLNQTALKSRGLDSTHRRQRHRGRTWTYYFVHDFGHGLKPMKLRRSEDE